MTPSKTPSQDSGVPLGELETDAIRLSPEEFADLHGSAFLLSTSADIRPPVGPGATDVELEDEGPPRGEATVALSLVAYPMQRGPQSVIHMVTVGRTGNNDVVIRDVSVSRFHAFVKGSSDEGFQIQDAGSTNGTTVNSTPVPVQGQGAPVDLKTGDNVRVGQVELTFLDAEALRDFVLAGAR